MSAADCKRILQKICKEFQGSLQLNLNERITLMSTQTMKREMHRRPGIADVTWALVWLIGGLLFLLASVYVPA
jgi:hypothetical protein